MDCAERARRARQGRGTGIPRSGCPKERKERCWLDATETALWSAYTKNRSVENRNALVEFHAEALHHAAWLYARNNSHVDIGDLISDGFFGLIDAIDGFEPQRGLKFTTYAAPRIRGSILDAIRRRDEMGRKRREVRKMLDALYQDARNRTNLPPSEKEVGRVLGKHPAIADRWVTGRAQCDGRSHTTGKPTSRFDFYDSERMRYETSQWRTIKTRDTFAAVLKLVPDSAEKMILSLVYREGLTMKECGRAIGMSESRVSQIHTMLMERLRGDPKTLRALTTSLADIAHLARNTSRRGMVSAQIRGQIRANAAGKQRRAQGTSTSVSSSGTAARRIPRAVRAARGVSSSTGTRRRSRRAA